MSYLKQMERFLKSCLKRKVKLTTDLMVTFLISGNLGYAIDAVTNLGVLVVNNKDETISKENYTISTNNNSYKSGILVTGDYNLSLNIAKDLIVDYYLSNTTDDTGWRRCGIQATKGGNIEIIAKVIKINSVTDNDLAVGIHAQRDEAQNGGNILVNSDTTSINVTSSNYFAYGIYVYNSTIPSNSINQIKSCVNINSNTTLIQVKGKNTGYSTGIIAWSEGQVKINKGNVLITADNIINTRGHSLVEINSDNNTNYDIKLTGNIVFEYNGDQSGTTVDSNIKINLANSSSFLKGNIFINGDPPVTKDSVSGMSLKISNGAYWSTVSEENNIFMDTFELHGGKFENNSETSVFSKNGIVMLGEMNSYSSILSGTGNLTGTSLNERLITISNLGNEFNLSDGATLTGNILIKTGATLENNGIFSVIGDINNSGKLTLNNGTTINLNNSGTFSNNEGAELIVTSGATAFTNGTATNKGIITLENTKDNLSKLVDNASLDSSGVIKLNDVTNKMSETDWNSLLERLSLNNGKVNISGAIVKNDGTSIFLAGNEITGDSTVGDIIDQTKDEESIKVEQDTVIIGSKEEDKTHIIIDKEINVGGNLTLKADDTSTGVALDKVTINVTNDKNIIAIGENHKFNETNINLVGNSNLVVGDGNTLTSLEISSGAITTDNTPSFIQTTDKSTLVLKDINVGIDIVGSEKGTGDVITNNTILEGNLEANNLLVIGNTVANGEVNFNKLVIGKLNSDETDIKELFLSSSAKLATSKTKMITFSDTNITPNTVTIAKDGQLTLEVADDGSNALSNSSGITIVKENSNTSLSKGEKADIVFVLADGTISKKIAIQINESNTLEAGLIFALNSEVYILEGNLKDGFYAVYNEQLTEAYQDKLNELNKLASNVGGYLSLDKDTRIVQLDKLYTNSIYSETVKATYDNVKLNEESILQLNIPTKIGEWSAGGKALYNKTKYSKKGVLKDNYNTKTDTAGLLGAMEYGIDEATSIGIAFSGANQNIRNNSGSADGTILYLGTYGKKEFKNYSIIGGIGYQFANYDTNNSAGSLSTSDNYNSNTISLYTEGKYSFDLGDNLSIQPKTKLGYTYVNQEDTMDNYFGIKDADISTFDIEIGTDIVKTLNISNGKIDLSLGSSYVRTLGDTDKEFNGRFIDSDGTAKVLGTQLSKNTGKFTFDVNISKDNGINYTTGVYLKVGSDSSRNYGASLGVGYTF